jgi:hypothetical protein
MCELISGKELKYWRRFIRSFVSEEPATSIFRVEYPFILKAETLLVGYLNTCHSQRDGWEGKVYIIHKG